MPLFPLPVSPFEHYMFADDRPDYPMTFFLRLRFRGRFERSRFCRALAGALRYHPLLAAHLAGSATDRTSRLAWIDSGGQSPWLDWQAAGAPLSFPRGQTYLDLTSEIGLRVWLREDDEGTDLVAQLHHACCDGLGTVQFIETLLEKYQNPDDATLPAGWEELHQTRHQTSGDVPARTLRERGQKILRIISGVRRYYRNRPVPLASPASNGVDRAARENPPALISHHFSEEETDSLRGAAKRSNVSSSALLLRDQMLALDEWNQAHSKDGRGRRLRIVLPINLRDGIRARTPAFNATSLRFVDRGPDELADPCRLLRGLHEQMQASGEIRRRPALLKAMKLLGKFPYALRARMRSDRCLGSAVFSNVGILFAGSPLLRPDRKLACADLVLEEVEAAPPVRPHTLASFCAMTYANRLTISLCYDSHRLTAEQGSELLAGNVRRLKESAKQPALG